MVLNRSADDGNQETVAVGDTVIVYEGYDSMKSVVVTGNSSQRFQCTYGSFPVNSWIGKPYGRKVHAGQGWVYILRNTPELWTGVLRHRTQILYRADISMICTFLDLRPGSVVLESGTGSGSLTHALARAVAPTGRVHTFEFHEQRCKEAAQEFRQNGVDSVVTTCQRNIEEAGFPEELMQQADAVFLDLPGPWKVVPSAHRCLKPSGRFCSFSPCIEQVQRSAEQLRRLGFLDVQCLECLLREYEVRDEGFERVPAPTSSTEAAAPPCGSAPPQEVQREAAPGASPAGAKASGPEGEAEEGEGDEDTPAAGEAALQVPVVAGPGGGKKRSRSSRDPASVEGLVKAAVVARPTMEARGHTGYLLFATSPIPLPAKE